MITITTIHPDNFSFVAGYLDLALRRGGGANDWNIGDVYEMLVKNECLVWIFNDDDCAFGAGVSIVYEYPRRKVVEILLMATDYHSESKWRDVLEQFKTYARAVGADAIAGEGRPGWARKLDAIAKHRFEIPVQFNGRSTPAGCEKCDRIT